MFCAVCSLVAQILGHVTWFLNTMGHKKAKRYWNGALRLIVEWLELEMKSENCGLIPAPEAPVMVKVKQKQQEARGKRELGTKIPNSSLTIDDSEPLLQDPISSSSNFIFCEIRTGFPKYMKNNACTLVNWWYMRHLVWFFS